MSLNIIRNMAIILIPICFTSILLNVWILSKDKPDFVDVINRSVLFFSLFLVLITELLSYLYSINYKSVLISWVVITLFNIAIIYKKNNAIICETEKLIRSIFIKISKLNIQEKILLFLIFLILTLTFIQGIIYPPNNWDSMTYHLARVPNWLSHQSVEHYPTHTLRQLYQPPFSSFVIMNFNTLSRNDLFSNSIQFFLLVFSLTAITKIVKYLKLSQKWVIIAIVLIVTIPEVILQASGTFNDIIVSYFILLSVYYGIKVIKEKEISNFIYFGLSSGFAILSKGTSYVYLFPIFFIYGFSLLMILIRKRQYVSLLYSLLIVISILMVNLPHYARNYNLNENILGITDFQTPHKDFNEKVTLPLFFSNFIKNIGLHIGPYPFNKISEKIIYKIHNWLHIDINDQSTNVFGLRYYRSPNIPNNEVDASNPIHIFLIFLSFLAIIYGLLKKRVVLEIRLYTFMILLHIILFCIIFKWTPWSTRLHTPLFILSVPLICFAFSKSKALYKVLVAIIPVLILYALFLVIFNYSRPLIRKEGITSGISIYENRFEKYFAIRPELYQEYSEILELISNNDLLRVGLIIDNDWEYPLFYECYHKKIQPVHICVKNVTNSISLKDSSVDCIVSTLLNAPYLSNNGKLYHNQTSQNKSIWIYK